MALYFFDFFDTQDGTYPDPEGTELPDRDAASDEAVLALIGLVNDIKPHGPHRKLQPKVRDSQGRDIWQVPVQFDVQPL